MMNGYKLSYHKIRNRKRTFFHTHGETDLRRGIAIPRPLLICTAVLAALTLLLAWSLLYSGAAGHVADAAPAVPQTSEQTETPAAVQEAAEQRFDQTQMVTLLTADGTDVLPLAAYLTGVLFAEMPASFSEEALKAQAVAARTFTLKTLGSDAHGGGICTDSACCQAWMDEHTLRERFGAAYEQAASRVMQAIEETDGIVAVYDGTLIDAVYFSCSGGRTEDAAAVWGGEVPYLQSVESPGEEIATHFTDTAVFSLEEFQTIILSADAFADLSGEPSGWFTDLTRTEGGGVAKICIGGVPFTGVEVRSLFGLRSAAFTVAVDADGVTFETSGYGHRVGLSQYGAEAMARAGADYTQILTHYYTGITLERLTA